MLKTTYERKLFAAGPEESAWAYKVEGSILESDEAFLGSGFENPLKITWFDVAA